MSYYDPVLDESNIEEHEYGITAVSKEFFHAPYNFNQYLLTCFLKKHYDEGTSILNHVSENLWIREDNFYAVLDMLQNKHGFKYVPANESLIFERKDCMIFLEREKNKEISKAVIYTASNEIAKELYADIEKFKTDITNLSFCWIVNAKGDVVNVTEEWEETVDASLYPFIKDFDTYSERFWKSKSNILILIGPPGTGKTTFIKHLLSSMDKTAYLTYDESVLNSDSSFADFISDDSAASFIIEDADLFLRSREDGNTMVSRFLNVGDGLIKLKNKKIIFSTNLPSVASLDTALVRPGRCFDILNFRSLTRSEAEVAADNRQLQLQVEQDTYTLAEIFNSPVAVKAAPKLGFY